FDLPARQFHILGTTFWPQDFIFLTLILIIAAISLFFFTAIAGRIWCGFACPQTVWTQTFIWIERLVEGERNQRIKLDKSPWSLRKFRIKTTKHFLWGLFALFTGYTFVGFFTPIQELTDNLLQFKLGPWEYFWVALYSLATYGNAGFLREQVCLHMCPYSRFQSAMFDNDTLIIAYDSDRGENRGHRKRTDQSYRDRQLGDCIDCYQCVNVCPTGIDIRDGLQYECIACAACIDVCDNVMDQMGYDKGLIRYSTENAMQDQASRILRPRTYVYAGILAICVSVFLISLSMRVPVELGVSRERQNLYTETFDGHIQNIYSIKVANMSQDVQEYRLSVSGLPMLKLIGEPTFSVNPGVVKTMTYRAIIHTDDFFQQSNVIYFTVNSTSNTSIKRKTESSFLGPIDKS
ncbi:MAG: cytochrome c oxidase accessory protein CcoG, partial [Kangiellaceae bacterium]|nr:cytochrome c oxidase accessory protein CcoG [Kangiellaceae bacterium]